ncbi:MAG: HYR domain-containing protein [Acidobacteriia bacterium]|nr:HYR domain-containing protein [Terriglobia bacterium]
MRKVVVSLAITLAAVWQAVPSALARDLTFEERVKAQEAIDRAYYSFLDQRAQPFEKAVTRNALERKVHTYLKQSAVLARFWRTPVTAEALQKEMERISRSSGMPDRLRKLYAALGNDPFLIQECLARPILVDRLVHNFFAYDPAIHAEQRCQSESLHEALSSDTLDAFRPAPGRTELEFVRRESDAEESASSKEAGEGDGATARRFELPPEDFEHLKGRLTGGIGLPAPIEEERTAFVIDVLIEDVPGSLRLARYTVPKKSWSEWWNEVAPSLDEAAIHAVATTLPTAEVLAALSPRAISCDPDGVWDNGSLDLLPTQRMEHTAVWTGSEMIVWGGRGRTYPQELDTGGRYDPVTDTWRHMSTAGAPSPRGDHTAVWTGTEMIVWGGYGGLNTGGRYNPVTDEWKPTSTVSAPDPRRGHTAAWTGREMIVWGGGLNSGGRYDPTTDSWTPTDTRNAPSSGLAIWTGRELLVWSGSCSSGLRYDPSTNEWTPFSATGAPSSCSCSTYSLAVWTGKEEIVSCSGSWPPEFGKYNPTENTWSPMESPEVGARALAWTADRVVAVSTQGIAAYDPADGTWGPTSPYCLDNGLWDPSTVSTDTLAIVWGGGESGGHLYNSGLRYDPRTGSCTRTSTLNAPHSMAWPDDNRAVWAGSAMVTWGGWGTPTRVDRYDVTTDSWSSVSAPLAGSVVSADGQVIWWDGTTGGRYDPVSDSWQPVSTANAPQNPQVLVSTGTSVVALSSWSGGVYDLATDFWTPIPVSGPPPCTGFALWAGDRVMLWCHSEGAWFDFETYAWQPIPPPPGPTLEYDRVVWTGAEMILWGAVSKGQGEYESDGYRFAPSTGTWTHVSQLDAPSGRKYYSMIWTGKEAVVWGGHHLDWGTDTGARYDLVTDTWTATPLLNAPTPRSTHSAVWTGSQMIIWGGNAYYINQDSLNTGGRYALGQLMDLDGDGYSGCEGDCDETNPNVHPGASEICDGIDNDCDGVTDNGGDALCDDGDACTDDACSGATGCAHTFRDAIPPTIICPTSVTVECQANLQSVVTVPPATATDVCQPSGLVIANSHTPSGADASGYYPLGTTMVNFAAADAAGNQATCQTTVTVGDTIPPVVTVVSSPSVLWPPNHRMATANNTVMATDICDPNPAIILMAVASNEPDDAQGGGDGQTTDDIQGASLDTPDRQVLLRAERDGGGSGRVYTMTYRASDISGNATNTPSMITVPHDMRDMAVEPLNLLMQDRDNTEVIWGPVEGAQHYDVIRGDLANLRVMGSDIDLGQVVCIEHATTNTTTVGYEDTEVPEPGHVFFYAVQYFDGVQDSSYGSESAGRARVVQSGNGDCQ